MMSFLVRACDACLSSFLAVSTPEPGSDPTFIGIFATLVSAIVLIGAIYLLLWSNFGARQGYLVLMVSFGAFMMIMSAIWLFGLPGTNPGTGPRGREAQWVPFTPTSEVARQSYPEAVQDFPGSDWEPLTEPGTIYPGNVDSLGELENLRVVITQAQARLAAAQETGGTRAQDWNFRARGVTPATDEEAELPEAAVYFQQRGTILLAGVRIPATGSHPEATVFAYRDRGFVYLPSLMLLIASVLIFVVHLILLARFEERQRRQTAAVEPAPVAV